MFQWVVIWFIPVVAAWAFLGPIVGLVALAIAVIVSVAVHESGWDA